MEKYVKPKRWVPTMYFMQGLPYAIVLTVTSIFYKNFGLSNAAIAFFTSLLLIPWSLKPIMAPVLEILATKKVMTVSLEFMSSICIGLIALGLISNAFIKISFVLFGCLAIISALHDITSDGLYIISLTPKDQAAFVGVRTSFYQLARLSCQGVFVMLVGFIATAHGFKNAWMITFALLGLISITLSYYHLKNAPQSEAPLSSKFNLNAIMQTFSSIIKEFFSLPNSFFIILFLFLYNMPEAQLIKIIPLFFLDKHTAGGLGLNNVDVGLLLGTIGVFGLMLGALIGGWLSARLSLRRVFIPITLLVLLANSGYLILSLYKPDHFWVIGIFIAVAQFAYGMSTSAYMTYLLFSVAKTRYAMSCYAIGTAIMAFGFIFAGSFSGLLQQILGYNGFFLWILLLCIFVLLLVHRMVTNYAPQESY